MKFKDKVIVTNLIGLDTDTINKIEVPMIHLGSWYENDTTFADLRNSKGESIRIFYERLENYTVN